MLISLYDKIKITIEEYNLTSSFNDKINIYAFQDIFDNQHPYLIKLFDISETPVVNVTLGGFLNNIYNINEVIAWLYTSLCRNFSYFKGLNYFLLSLSLIIIKTQPPDSSSLFDLIIVVSNSFELLKKLMEPSLSDIILLILDDPRDIYHSSTSVVLNYFCFNWNRIINKEIISITESVLYFSLFYIKNPLFQKSFIYLKKLRFYCSKFHFIINTWKNSSDEHFNLIKSLFKDSSPFFSFLSTVSPSKDTPDILKFTSQAIILLENENIPEEISNYLKLISF
jgi:hypothetical protein